MAQINKQDVAILHNIDNYNTYKLDISKKCELVNKIWDKKEVKRFHFNLADNDGHFECSEKMGEQLQKEIENLHKCGIDKDKIKEIEICIYENKISINLENLPRINMFKKFWSSIKG